MDNEHLTWVNEQLATIRVAGAMEKSAELMKVMNEVFCLTVSLSLSLSLSVCVCLSVYLSACLPVLSVSLSVLPDVLQSVSKRAAGCQQTCSRVSASPGNESNTHRNESTPNLNPHT